ncbi:hypothetical protein V1478_008287 [Vespula squamosa]|uniref:Uncharacterized protein n=1 Tax=Vespula squamosa TaxID=30214 RepID=A0ABD2AYC0_VESSQ
MTTVSVLRRLLLRPKRETSRNIADRYELKTPEIPQGKEHFVNDPAFQRSSLLHPSVHRVNRKKIEFKGTAYTIANHR